MSEWFCTDEAEEAVSTLEAASRFLQGALNDPFTWRWVILSLHISAQGFTVIALRDSAGLIPLRDDIARSWLKAYRAGTPLPEQKLDSFRNLYKKVRRTQTAESLQATPFKPTASQEWSIKLLCDFRDQFTHFLPRSWSIEVSGLPQMSSDVLDYIEFVSCEYRPLCWDSEEHPKRIRAALLSARRTLGRADIPAE